MKQKIVYWSGVCVLLAANFMLLQVTCRDYYMQGYQHGCGMFKQWLLDVEYAEYDRRTGEWRLSEVEDIKGRYIEPSRRSAHVNIDDHARALEEELSLVRRQQAVVMKRKGSTKLDVSMVP